MRLVSGLLFACATLSSACNLQSLGGTGGSGALSPADAAMIARSINVEPIWQLASYSKAEHGLCMSAALESWQRWEHRQAPHQVPITIPFADLRYQQYNPDESTIWKDWKYEGIYKKENYFTKFEIFDSLPEWTWQSTLFGKGTLRSYVAWMNSKKHSPFFNGIGISGVLTNYRVLMRRAYENLYFNDELRQDPSPSLIAGRGSPIDTGIDTLDLHVILITGMQWSYDNIGDGPAPSRGIPLKVSFIDPGEVPHEWYVADSPLQCCDTSDRWGVRREDKVVTRVDTNALMKKWAESFTPPTYNNLAFGRDSLPTAIGWLRDRSAENLLEALPDNYNDLSGPGQLEGQERTRFIPEYGHFVG